MTHSNITSRGRRLVAVTILGVSLSLAPLGRAAVVSTGSPVDLGGFASVSLTQGATLNDLVRRLPILSRAHEEDLAGLSAVQERMLIHERRMRGEGLPAEYQQLFSDNYTAIVTAIIDDRITMRYGRELLCVHRQLLDRAYGWNETANKDAHYGEVVILALKDLREELDTKAEPLAVVPECVRTPVVKGHLLWIEELLQADCYCRVLSRGELGAQRVMAQRIERFEGYYKRDLHLTRIERENLHERLIDLNRELIDALRS
ncbi:MAG: hypothetical protein KDM64_07740 [Verrucomicrobiae bacterium]|nr:hypothetical protein [Verrucomicrobiae bacterium]